MADMCKYCKIVDFGLAEYACPGCPTAPKDRRRMSLAEADTLLAKVKNLDLGSTGRAVLRARAIELVLGMTDQQIESALAAVK